MGLTRRASTVGLLRLTGTPPVRLGASGLPVIPPTGEACVSHTPFADQLCVCPRFQGEE
jgi:hypothetical protein